MWFLFHTFIVVFIDFCCVYNSFTICIPFLSFISSLPLKSSFVFCKLCIIYNIHILTFQKKWNSLTFSVSGGNSVFTPWMSTMLDKPCWGVQPSPAASNIRPLLTDEGEAARLWELGRICDCRYSVRRENGKKVTEQAPGPSMWCWRNELTPRGRSQSTEPRERPGPGTPEKENPGSETLFNNYKKMNGNSNMSYLISHERKHAV